MRAKEMGLYAISCDYLLDNFRHQLFHKVFKSEENVVNERVRLNTTNGVFYMNLAMCRNVEIWCIRSASLFGWCFPKCL
jgi:hypothetical protein